LILRQLLRDCKHLVRVGLHLCDRRVRRTDQLRQHHTLVLLRRQLGLRSHEQICGTREQQHTQDDQHLPCLEPARQYALVARTHRREAAVDELGEAPLFLLRLEEARAHHRRKCQCNDRGHRDRPGEGKRKLGKQGAGQPALKADGQIGCHENHGHRDDRSAQLACTLQRCLERRHALFEMAVHVLDHDDRIIHDQPDREHERQKREEIDRVTQREHQEERAYERERHRDHRNDHCAQATQEQIDHRSDDQQRLDQRLDDLLDRGVDEYRGVVS